MRRAGNSDRKIICILPARFTRANGVDGDDGLLPENSYLAN